MQALRSIKKFLKRTPLYDSYVLNQQQSRIKQEIAEWEKQGKPIPTPAVLKHLTVQSYANQYNLETLIETGTFMGDTIEATKTTFRRIFSIELDTELHERAKQRFSKDAQVLLLQGDSTEVLPKLLQEIDEPCLFWLDGHYSHGSTAKGKLETPIMHELDAIFSHSIENHVILIDDARCFNGENDYPTVKEVRQFVLQRRPNWQVEQKDDILRLHNVAAR